MLVGLVLVGTAVAMPTAATADMPDLSPAAIVAASAEVPEQPQADPGSGWVVGPETPGTVSGAMEFTADGPRAASRADSWTRTCERGYGTESWNTIKTSVCAGTVTWYKNGNLQKSVNILAFQAQMGSDLPGADLDGWCAAYPFQCGGFWALASVAFTILWGIIG